ncbi:MAG: hypothetical protein JKX97_05280 [Candidatus Lindowbacteria bacterium]|nr:hypothetical protein [Candidatus Lindowbacteria bacterium]
MIVTNRLKLVCSLAIFLLYASSARAEAPEKEPMAAKVIYLEAAGEIPLADRIFSALVPSFGIEEERLDLHIELPVWCKEKTANNIILALEYAALSDARISVEQITSPVDRFHARKVGAEASSMGAVIASSVEDFGGIILERDSIEPNGSINNIVHNLHSFSGIGGGIIKKADFKPLGNFRFRFDLPSVSQDVLVTVVLDDPRMEVSLEGAGLPEAKSPDLSSALIRQFWIKESVGGSYSVKLNGGTTAPKSTGRRAARRVRVYIQGSKIIVEKPKVNPQRVGIFNQNPRGIHRVANLMGVQSDSWQFEMIRSRIDSKNEPSDTPIVYVGSKKMKVIRRTIQTGETGKNAIEIEQIRFDPPQDLYGGAIEVTIQLMKPEQKDTYAVVLEFEDDRDIEISEVHPGEDWVELRIMKDIPDLSIYQISDLDGKSLKLPNKSVKKDGIFVVAFNSMAVTELARNVSARDKVLGLPEDMIIDKEDQIVLYKAGAVVDAVTFASSATPAKNQQSDLKWMRKRGVWKGKPIRYSQNDESVGRFSNQWISYSLPSPGIPNPAPKQRLKEGDIRISEFNVWGPEKAWLELEALETCDAANLIVSDWDGVPKRLIEQTSEKYQALILEKGECLLIKWDNGISEIEKDLDGNGFRTIYKLSRPPSRTFDQIIIESGDEIIDAVMWRSRDVKKSKSEIKDLELLMEKLGQKSDDSLLKGLKLYEFKTVGGGHSLKRSDGVQLELAVVPSPGKVNPEYVAPKMGSILITAFNPVDPYTDWAEITNVGDESVDVAPFVLSDLDGVDQNLSSEPLILEPGDTLIVRWAEGKNEPGVVFLSTDEPLSSTDDQIVLLWGETIYDVVMYENGDGRVSKTEKKDIDFLYSKKEWNGKPINLGIYRLAVQRKTVGPNRFSDTRKKNDWAHTRYR